MREGWSLAMQPDCLKGRVVCGTVYGDMHLIKRSPGINRKSRVSYPGPGFLSSATWPSQPKKHCKGLIVLTSNRCHASFLKPLVLSLTIRFLAGIFSGQWDEFKNSCIMKLKRDANTTDEYNSYCTDKKRLPHFVLPDDVAHRCNHFRYCAHSCIIGISRIHTIISNSVPIRITIPTCLN